MVAHRGAGQPAALDAASAYGLGADDARAADDARSASTSRSARSSGRCCAGARLRRWPRPAASRDPAYLPDVIARRGVITAATSSPRMLPALLDAGRRSAAPALRAVAGAAARRCRPTLRGAARAAAGARGCYNLYGPTEATVDVDRLRTCAAGRRRAPVPIGRPIANTRVYVLDARGEPVPVGVAGELYIGGAGVARGYLGPPGADGGALRPRPVRRRAGRAAVPHRRPGRWRPDGDAGVPGPQRLPGEGARLPHRAGRDRGAAARASRVREAAVLARADAAGDKRLVAWYAADETLDVAALRAHLAEQLPEYMVPAAFVWLERCR